jgi:uncharacterized protein
VRDFFSYCGFLATAMLIRVSITNFKSFNEETEFNMLPSSEQRTHKGHVYAQPGVDLLKMAAIYGANGAGKSNLVRAIGTLKRIVLQGGKDVLNDLHYFKLNSKNENLPTTIEVEFLKNEIAYIFGISITENIIVEEWLYISKLGKSGDILLFHRHKLKDETKLNLSEQYLASDIDKFKMQFIRDEILRDDILLFKELASLKEGFQKVKSAYSWFTTDLILLSPQTKLATEALGLKFDNLENYQIFSNDIINSFETGIYKLTITDEDVDEKFFGEEKKQLMDIISKRFSEGEKYIVFSTQHEWSRGSEVVIIQEKGKYIIRGMIAKHKSKNQELIDFAIEEESDGTNRLLDFVPAFYILINASSTVIIDEIDQSIHPALLKELVRKFADDDNTKGQLIFTTHESNLLDQSMLRRDEIWFAEKHEGATKLYPMSDFDIRLDLDIRKGYLNGRFGAIPFLGNLKDLNWSQHAETE